MTENAQQHVYLPFDRWAVVDEKLSEFIARTAPADPELAERRRHFFAAWGTTALVDASPEGSDLGATRRAFLDALEQSAEPLPESDRLFVEQINALSPRDPDFVEKMESLVLAHG